MLYNRIEIQDENNQAFVVFPDRRENRGFTAVLRRFNRSELTFNVRNLGTIKSRIKFGNEVRLYSDSISQDKLVLMLHFDGNIKDDGPKKHTGTDSGTVEYVNSKFGKARKFGTNRFVQFADHADFRFATEDEFTIETRIKTSSTAPFDIICSKRDGTLGTFNYQLFFSNNDLVFQGQTGNTITFANSGLRDGKEHTIKLTFKNGAGKLYADGVLRASNTGLILTSGTQPLYIGKDDVGSFFNGEIDLFRLYRREHTAQEASDSHTSEIQHKQMFTGVILDYVGRSTTAETLTVYCKDIFADRKASGAVNKKYPDQEVSTTVTDIITNHMGGGFTTTGIQTIGVSQPYNFVSENRGRAIDRIASSSLSEIFMRADKDVVMRPIGIDDSEVTIIDAMIRDPETISVKRGITETYGVVRVIGGLDVNGKRVLVEEKVLNAADNIKNRVHVIVDERFTTRAGAKAHAITVAKDLGEEMHVFDQSLNVHDLTKWADVGQLVRINSNTLAIDKKFIVEEIKIRQAPGEDRTRFVTLTVGKTEQQELEIIKLLEDEFENDKRKELDADAITNQHFFSAPVGVPITVTVTVTKRNVITNPYVWHDAGDADITQWGAASWA